MLFENNTYSHIYSLDSAIVKASVFGSTTVETRVIHNHTNENIYDVQNGAYSYFGGNQDLLVFFYDMYMLDSYGVTLDTVEFPNVITKTLM